MRIRSSFDYGASCFSDTISCVSFKINRLSGGKCCGAEMIRRADSATAKTNICQTVFRWFSPLLAYMYVIRVYFSLIMSTDLRRYLRTRKCTLVGTCVPCVVHTSININNVGGVNLFLRYCGKYERKTLAPTAQLGNSNYLR